MSWEMISNNRLSIVKVPTRPVSNLKCEFFTDRIILEVTISFTYTFQIRCKITSITVSFLKHTKNVLASNDLYV